MDKREELLRVLNAKKHQYLKKILLKGIFFLFGGNYYPIKLFLFPSKDEKDINPKQLDYEDLLLIEDWVDVDFLEKFINSLGEESESKILPYQIRIPRGYFRDVEEDSAKIIQQYGEHSNLSDFERRLLEETRSFPKSLLRQWPTKTYLFKFQIQNNCNNLYHKKSREPLPLKEGLPAIPEYRAAFNWWLSQELFYLPDWVIAFYLPDFSARIQEVKFSKDSFIIDIEAGISALDELVGKYYIEYENISPETGKAILSETDRIQIKDKVNRFYVVIYNEKEPSVRIDYRDYDWRHTHRDRESFDIEYEEEGVEYLVTRGENEELELKLEIENEKTEREFLETVCSFSNSYGGQIFIGIDNNRNVKGLNEIQIERYTKKIPDLIRNWIEPQVQLKIKITELKDKKVIMVSITKGSNPPYNYRDHGIYIRAKDRDQIATRDEFLSLVPERESYFKYR